MLCNEEPERGNQHGEYGNNSWQIYIHPPLTLFLFRKSHFEINSSRKREKRFTNYPIPIHFMKILNYKGRDKNLGKYFIIWNLKMRCVFSFLLFYYILDLSYIFADLFSLIFDRVLPWTRESHCY